MAGIGLKIKISSLITQGPKSLLAEILIFSFQLIVVTELIHLLF